METADFIARRAAAVVCAAPFAWGGGRTLCTALSDLTDEWLRSLAEPLLADAAGRYALVAVGGYGRGALAPFSDLDVVLVHDAKRGVTEVAERLWYPVWDAKLRVGHGVLSIKEARQLIASDLEPATSYLSARHIAGDALLAGEFADAVRSHWAKHHGELARQVVDRTDRRHDDVGDVAFLLEPNLKDGRGGLRDVHTTGWLASCGVELEAGDRDLLRQAEDVLLTGRAALHTVTGRHGDVLHLEQQDAVATQTPAADADALMATISSAARTIAWIVDGALGRVKRSSAPASDRAVAPGVHVRGGEVVLAADAPIGRDPSLALRVARAAAHAQVPIERVTLARLAAETEPFPSPWPSGALDDLVALLLEGHDAIEPLEALDQMGLLTRVLPEWEQVRNKPQRNAYHRFTVDRHLLEAVANAAALADRVARPDLLVIGTLLHDIGKGRPGDHTDNGVAMAEVIGPRLGFSPADCDVLGAMVRHHLLLPDVATRRDLSDDGTITAVATAAGSPVVLELLHALTIADSMATGPSAWGSWKAELVEVLVDRAGHVLGGGAASDVTWRPFPTDDVLELMAHGAIAVVPSSDRVITVAPDRPGLFAAVAGVLSLHALDVLGAEAHSDTVGETDEPMAANEFRVVVPKQGVDWARIESDLRRALAGQLALEARLAERARTYRRRRAQSATPPDPNLRIDNATSSDTTVLEIRAPDRIGVLYRMTKALAEMGLDIRHARVQTLADEVIDTFAVQHRGAKVSDEFHLREVEQAILHAVRDG